LLDISLIYLGPNLPCAHDHCGQHRKRFPFYTIVSSTIFSIQYASDNSWVLEIKSSARSSVYFRLCRFCRCVAFPIPAATVHFLVTNGIIFIRLSACRVDFRTATAHTVIIRTSSANAVVFGAPTDNAEYICVWTQLQPVAFASTACNPTHASTVILLQPASTSTIHLRTANTIQSTLTAHHEAASGLDIRVDATDGDRFDQAKDGG